MSRRPLSTKAGAPIIEPRLTGTVAGFAEHGASVALVARRRDRIEALAAEIDKAGRTALVVEADITDRTQAEAAVQQTVEHFGRFDILVNNAGLMLLGPLSARTPWSGTA